MALIKRYYADKTSLRLVQLMLLAMTLLLLILVQQTLTSFPAVRSGVSFTVIVLCLFCSCIYLPLAFRNLIYHVSTNEITKYSGIFLQRKQAIRCSAIQHSTSVTTPLSRVTGLNFLVLNAFGGRVMLLFLTKKDLEEILRTIRR